MKPIKSAGRRAAAKKAVSKSKPKSAKQVAKSLHLKAMRMFGGNALKVMVEPEPHARSLSLELLKGIARGNAISHQPWDGKLVQEASREVLTIIGEIW